MFDYVDWNLCKAALPPVIEHYLSKYILSSIIMTIIVIIMIIVICSSNSSSSSSICCHSSSSRNSIHIKYKSSSLLNAV